MSEIDKRSQSNDNSLKEEDIILDRNKLVAFKCELNNGSLYNSTASARVFKCEQCEMDYLCAHCMIHCHKPYHKDKVSFAPPCAPIDHLCSCGLRDHKIQKEDTKRLSRSLKHKTCYLSVKEFKNIVHILKKDKKTNMVLCLFCIEACYKGNPNDYDEVIVLNKETIKCGCTMDQRDHVQSSLQGIIQNANRNNLNHFELANTFITNYDLSRITYKLLFYIHEMIYDFFTTQTITEDNMTPKAFDLIDQIRGIETKGKEEFDLFVSCLKKVRRFPNSYWINQEVSKYFNYEHVIKVLSIPESETKNGILILVKLFYCTCFRLMYCPKTSAIEMFTPNVSSIHRIFFLKKPTSINDANATPEQIRKILIALKPMMHSIKDPAKCIKCMNEYLKLLEYLIDSNINDFNNAQVDFREYTADMFDQFKRVSQILETQAEEALKTQTKEESSNHNRQGKLFKLQRVIEKMVIYQNDYYFFYKMFKKQINFEKEGNHSTKEDNHFSFENNQFNQLLIDLLVDTNPNTSGEDYDYKNLLDMLFNTNDCFIDSLEQIVSHQTPFDPSIINIIENKDEEFLKIEPIKEQLNQIKVKITQIEDMIYEATIPKNRLNHEEVIQILNKIYEIMLKISKDKNYSFRFQFVFVSTQLYGKLMNIFELANKIDQFQDPNKNDNFKRYQTLLYSILYIICENNAMTTTLLFNHNRNKKNKFALLALNNNEAFKFYLRLLKILRKCKHKINTDIYCELFQSYLSKITTDSSAFTINELMIILHTAKLMITVSTKKCNAVVCQSLIIQLNLIYQNFKYNGMTIGNILKESLHSYQKEHIDILEPFFSFINKFNNDTFDLFKETIDIEDITERLNESNSIDSSSSVGMTMLIAELVLFYSQYNFSSLYTRDADRLIHYSQIQIYVKKMQPFFNYLEYFNRLLHDDLHERQLLNCFIKGVCVPSTLLLWKISSFAMLDGVAKYSIYNITCWFFIHFKKVLEILEGKFLKSNKKEQEINFILEAYFSEIITREELYMIVKEKHDDITSKQFPCLEETNCLTKFFDVIQHLKFFINSQELMKEKLMQDRDPVNNSKIQRDIKNLSFFGKLRRAIDKYNDLKSDYQNDNVLIELFNEDLIVNDKGMAMGSILINSIAKEIKNYDDICPMNLSDYFTVFDMSKVPYLTIITKLFKKNPKLWQDIILENTTSSYLIYQLISIAIKVFAQFVFADYTRIIVNNSIYYYLLIESIEFLRLLCEDHNPFFQTILIQNSRDFMPIDYPIFDLIFDISVEITKHVRHFSMQNTIASQFFKKENYFKKLSEKLCEYQTEIIQGTRYENLVSIAFNNSFNAFIDSYYEFMDYCTEGLEYAYLSAEFLKFINCFFEEFLVYKHMPLEEYINPLLGRLNPKRLVSFGEKSFFKMIIPRIEKNEDIPLSIFSQNIRGNKDKNYFELTYKCVKKILKDIYLEYDTLAANPYFMNAFNIFLHLTQIRDFKNDKYSSYQQILTNLEISEKEEKYSGLYYKVCSFLLLNNEVMYTLDFAKNHRKAERYIELFNVLDIFKRNKFLISQFEEKMFQVGGIENIKKTNRLKIYYLAQKDSVLLKKTDFESFDQVSNYEDYFTKLSGILNYYDDYSDKVDMRKHFLQESKPFLIKLNELNYDLLEKINCCLCLVPNFLLIIKSPGDIYSHILFYWVLLQLVFDLVIISIFVFFNCFKLTLFDDKKKISIQDIGKFIVDQKIFPFEWVFFWGLLGLRFDFLLSLQLFAIFNISETMKSALNAIQTRYDQFLSTGFLLVILLLFYAAVTLYFFTDKGDGTYYCQDYLSCFLYLLNNGLRGGGLPFENKIREMPGYWSEFVYSWIFYFLIILIILNIVNGIIVDTFQELREKNNEIALSRRNVCFICQLTRAQFDNKGMNFDEHCETEHNVLNYFKYLFKIKRTDQHDLNSVNLQVYNTIKAGRVDFFPIDRANGFDEPKARKALDEEDNHIMLADNCGSEYRIDENDEMQNNDQENSTYRTQLSNITDTIKQEEQSTSTQKEDDKTPDNSFRSKKSGKQQKESKKPKEKPEEKEEPEEKNATFEESVDKPKEKKEIKEMTLKIKKKVRRATNTAIIFELEKKKSD